MKLHIFLILLCILLECVSTQTSESSSSTLDSNASASLIVSKNASKAILFETSTSNISQQSIEPTTEKEHIAVLKWRAVDKIAGKMVSALYKSILPFVLRANEELNITSQCSRGLMKMLIGMKQMKLWAFKMLDSSGKIPNGIISGSINSLGDYDECLSVDVPGQFRGQYCTVDLSPPLPERRPFVPSESEIPEFVNFSKPDLVMSDFLKKANYYHSLNFRSSVCFPSTCTRNEIHMIANKVIKMAEIDFDIEIPNCEVLQDKIDFSNSEITIIVVLTILILLGILATIIDVTLKLMSKGEAYQEKLSLPMKYLLCFSFYTNTLRLLKPDTSTESIKIFHGMKVITILWVILNHTYYYLNYQACSTLLNAREVGREIAFQFIANGFLNVETFFFISSVLVAYGVMKMKEKKLNIFLYIFRRIWRLMPPFMFVISVVFLVPHLGSGPVWKETVVDQLTSKCQANWWTNLIFINNFIPSSEMCLQWMWYIPVDTHLYFLSLIVLIPLKNNPRLAFAMNALILICGIIISSAFHFYYNLTPTAIYAFNHPDDINYYVDRGYFRTYLHTSTYCVGLTVGYVIAKRPKVRIPLLTNLLGWVSSFVMSLSVLYGVYDWNQGNVPGMVISVIYASTKTLVWSLALAWVTISCFTGNGGIATTILSWPVFVPFGRLTYMAYLIHPVIHMIYTGSTRTLIRTDHRAILYLYLGNVLLSFMCAYGLSLMFESPFMALEKVMFSSRRPVKKPISNKIVAEEPQIIHQHRKSRIVEDNGVYAINIKQEANG